MPLTPIHRRLKLEDCHEFKVSLCHIVNIRLDRATLQNPASKKPKTNQNIKTEKKNPKDTWKGIVQS